VLYYTLRTRLRVQRAPGIPHALRFVRGGCMHGSGASRREIAKLCRKTMRLFEIEVGVCEALPKLAPRNALVMT